MKVGSEEAFPEYSPGQFLILRNPDQVGYLGRPFTIACGDPSFFQVIYKLAGEGTAKMTQLPWGTELQVVGPLGNGFDLSMAKSRALLVAGGMGITPLLPLAKALRSKGVVCDFFLGAATEQMLIGCEELEKIGVCVKITTDDGSLGYHGYPTHFVNEALENDIDYDIIYACGPEPLLKAIVALVKGRIPMQVSLERHMACGMGACTACACKTKGKNGSVAMKRVCKEGPVFFAHEVVWDG